MFKETRSGIFQCSTLLLCILVSLRATLVVGDGNFTKIPEDVILVESRKTAKFEWSYTVKNRLLDFDSFSPTWSFYNASGYKFKIGHESRTNDWAWEVTPNTCPPRLLYPVQRVNKTSVATLIIKNVTTADSGIYGCTLALSRPKTSKVELVVTVPPQISITGESSVLEYTNVTLNCSAVGPPTPNVTWINDAGVIIEQGIQSAILIIVNITKEQHGTIYTCNATNNPNEDPVQKKIPVTIKDCPSINKTLSNYTQTCPGKKVDIRCAANGYPLPTYYWYNPSNVSVGENKTGRESKIPVNPVHGNWTCYITNGVCPGIYFKLKMDVLSENDESCVKPVTTGCTTLQIVGFVIGFLIAAVIIAVIVVVIYKKEKDKRKWKEWTTLEKVLIPLGVIVAIIIIIVVIVFIVQCA